MAPGHRDQPKGGGALPQAHDAGGHCNLNVAPLAGPWLRECRLYAPAFHHEDCLAFLGRVSRWWHKNSQE
jgi:hypothetical protein